MCIRDRTYIDPLLGGGRLNARTPPGLIERIELGGRPWLWYKSLPIHVGLIRATVAGPGEHDQTFGEELNPAYFSVTPGEGGMQHVPPPMPLDERKIIAGRACD